MMKTISLNRIIRHVFVSIVLVSLIGLVTFVSASGENSDKAQAKYSLQFGIDKEFDLDDFAGMHLSVRKHHSSQRAWRLGARIAFSTGNDDGEQSRIDTGVVVSQQSESSNTQLNTSISLLHEWQHVGANSINGIVGFGPELGFRVSDQESSNRYYQDSGTSRKYDRNVWSYQVGLRGVMGVEWFFTDQMSLMAEYSLSVAYFYESYKRTDTYDARINKSKSSRNTFKLATNSVNFGVSVYF